MKLLSPEQNLYFHANKTILLLLFAWLFRLCFLLQGSYGMVAINKWVFLQISLIIGLGVKLLGVGYIPSILLSHPSTAGFALLYLFGMISMFWSVMPLMSCYFAFENLVCMTALLYLTMRCKDQYQMEILFIYVTIAILCMFPIRNITIGGSWHSVTYSSIGAMLFTYCLGEYSAKGRPPENVKALKSGIIASAGILIVTTSGGALFSTTLALCVLALFAQNNFVRTISLLTILTLILMFFFGAQERVLDIIFPGKSVEAIMSGHGRAYVWDMIYKKIAERPWFGWGYAAVERILPVYCTDAHNAIIGIRGSLGNIGGVVLIIVMVSQLIYLYYNRHTIGYKGCFVATLCAFINSNTSNFIAAKAGPCSFVFVFLLVLGRAYDASSKLTKSRLQH